MDKSSFIIRMAKELTVAIKDPSRPSYIASTTNKNYITVVKCVSGNANFLPPFVVLPGQFHMEDWYTKTNMDNSYMLAVSESGYLTDALTLDWFQLFDKNPRSRQKSRY